MSVCVCVCVCVCEREKDAVCLLSVSIREDSSLASDGSFVLATLISVSKQQQQVGISAHANHMTTESLHLDVTVAPGALPLGLLFLSLYLFFIGCV